MATPQPSGPFRLPLRRTRIRNVLLYSIFALQVAVALFSVVAGKIDSDGKVMSKEERQADAEHRRQTRRMYSLFDHMTRICVITFFSAVFAGLTLGVMCADTFTLEVIAESGPAPDCKYAAQVLPLRRQGHKTLCTLIISNMLCNVLIVQEFSSLFDIIHAIRTQGNTNNVVDDSGSQLLNFIASTTMIVLFAEVVPMSICKSKYSLKVAAAGSIFVRVAMVLTYPVSAPLGKFLDWIVGTEETGQVYDRNELRKLMMVHYDHEGERANMPKSELNLLLAAMDFQERKVKDIMTPIEEATVVSERDVVTSDFVERLWLSGRSRVPVESEVGGHFCDVLVVKDLLTINTRSDEEPVTVAQIVKAKHRLFAMVGENTSLPTMMKYFQDAKTHMAVVFAEETPAVEEPVTGTPSVSGSKHSLSGAEDETATPADEALGGGTRRRKGKRRAVPEPELSSTARRAPGAPATHSCELMRTVGILTMEDVVEEMLNDEIYDEYDRYDPQPETLSGQYSTASIRRISSAQGDSPPVEELRVPEEPEKPPRVNFYSYFTHPEQDLPLTEAQVWAAVYFLSRSVRPFMLWPPAYIKLLLDSCGDQQLVSKLRTTSSPNHADDDAERRLGALASENSSKGTPSSSDPALAVVPPLLGVRSPLGSDRGGATTTPSVSIGSPTTMQRLRLYEHTNFLSLAKDESFVMYSMGTPSEYFTLVLGGQVDMLVGNEKFYNRLCSFQHIGSEALTQSFYVPDFSAVVTRAARVYRIPKSKYEKFLSQQSINMSPRTNLRVLRPTQSSMNLPTHPAMGFPAGRRASPPRRRIGRERSASPAGERDGLLRRSISESVLVGPRSTTKGRAYGTFNKE